MIDIRPDPQIQFDYDILECLRECSEENIADYSVILKAMKEAKHKSKGSFGVIIE